MQRAILLSKNEKLVEEFFDSLPIIKEKRKKSKYLTKLTRMSEALGDFEKVSKRDLRKYIESIELSDLKPWTKRDYKLIAKKFFRWLHSTEFVEWIRLGRIKATVSVHICSKAP